MYVYVWSGPHENDNITRIITLSVIIIGGVNCIFKKWMLKLIYVIGIVAK
jgi:hypothetical protein